MAYLEYEPTSTLFQFTSNEGFRGILKSRSLWFSDLRSLNDPRELILGLGTLRELLEEIIEEESEEWDTVFLRKFLIQSYNSLDNTDFYSCSFCLTGDSMPLWQHYGYDGKGVSIGFRPRALTDIPCRIQKVDYINKDSTLDDLKDSFRLELSKFAKMNRNILAYEGIKLSSRILSICTSIKHSTWDHEKEIRAVYSQSRERESVQFMEYTTSMHSDGSEMKWTEPLTRSSQDGVVKYLPFDFGKLIQGHYDPAKAIEKVVIGPNSSMSVPEAETILASEGFRGVKVTTSECLWR